MKNIPEIEFEEVSGRGGNLGLITLTRQHVLNALNQQMINVLDQQLAEWEAANHIKTVVIRASGGRAFCAGGDVRSVHERKIAQDPKLTEFFRDEYRMNRRIRNYKKPYIALIDGIAMGGGVGISVHASHRVATEHLLFAMPETGIGFYPDVGTTYVLSRLPHNIGYYLGLTGARIKLNDCIAAGLIDHQVKPEQFPELIFKLADTAYGKNELTTITELIKDMAVPAGNSELWQYRDIIEKCFGQTTVEEIIAALEKYPDLWCKEAVTLLKAKAPTSLKVTLRALREAAQLEFNDAIQMEFRITSHFLEGHDFFEGIRAVLVDKDQAPNWQPPQLTAVTHATVEKYFVPLENELL